MRESLGCIGDQNVLAMAIVQAFSANGRGYDRQPLGPGIQYLDPHTAPSAQRHHEYLAASPEWFDLAHIAGRLDILGGLGPYQTLGRLAADRQKASEGHTGPDGGQNRLREPARAIGVGWPMHTG